MIEVLIGLGVIVWVVLVVLGFGMILDSHYWGFRFWKGDYAWWEYLLCVPLCLTIAGAVLGLAYLIGSLFTMGAG